MTKARLRTARRVVGQPNKSEQMYMDYLDKEKCEGRVLKWHFETFTLRLADGTTYTPDFYILFSDGHVEFHETKGHSFREGRLKFKMAAELFPEFEWHYVKIKYQKGKPVVTKREVRR